MSRKIADKNGRSAVEKVSWKGFVNVYLNAADKKAIKHNLATPEEVMGLLEALSGDGYKVSVTYSEKGGFYTVTAYGNDPSCINAGWAMSLRHSDLVVAFSALRHVVEMEGVSGDWSERFTTVNDNNW